MGLTLLPSQSVTLGPGISIKISAPAHIHTLSTRAGTVTKLGSSLEYSRRNTVITE